MIRKTAILFMFIAVLLITSNLVLAVDETITHKDKTNDVEDENLENVVRPDLDIEQITAIKSGREVELKLKLASGGTIQKSNLLSSLYIYGIVLTTTHQEYYATYIGIDVSSLDPEDLEDIDPGEIGDLACSVTDLYDESIEVNSYTGEGENELSIKFNIYDSDERLIALSAGCQDYYQGFYDDFQGKNILIQSDEFYNATAGDQLELSATLENEELEPTDFTWLWFFEDSDIVLEGQTASHNFKIPGSYSGKLYVFDSDGNYGYNLFVASVKGEAINGGDDNDEPGFEVLTLIVAIAIAIFIFRKRK